MIKKMYLSHFSSVLHVVGVILKGKLAGQRVRVLGESGAGYSTGADQL